MEAKTYDPHFESQRRRETALIAARIIQIALPSVVDVLLFGSVARGEARPNSDIDIAVVTSAQVSWTDLDVIDALIDADQEDFRPEKASWFNPTVVTLEQLKEGNKFKEFYASILRDGVSLL